MVARRTFTGKLLEPSTDWLKGVSPAKAAKLLASESYEDWERVLAKHKFWDEVAFFDGHTRKFNPEYFDIATARKVATAVQLMEIIYNRRVTWNQVELDRLFNKRPKSSQ